MAGHLKNDWTFWICRGKTEGDKHINPRDYKNFTRRCGYCYEWGRNGDPVGVIALFGQCEDSGPIAVSIRENALKLTELLDGGEAHVDSSDGKQGFIDPFEIYHKVKPDEKLTMPEEKTGD